MTSKMGFLAQQRWIGVLLFGGALMWGCSDDPRAALALDDDADAGALGQLCVDKDRDGYGRGCELGPDCDDNDVDSTTECRVATCEKTPTAEGCPCEGEAVADCEHVTKKFGDKVICGYGARVCNEGKWSECRIVGVRVRSSLEDEPVTQ